MTESTIVSLIETAPAAPRRARKDTGCVTLSDLAKLVGATKATVPHALNTPELMSGDMLERVCEAMRQAGYTPDLVANSLTPNYSRLTVALIPAIVGSVFREAVAALTTELVAASYQLLIGQSGYDKSREDVLFDAIVGRRPAGIVLIGVIHPVSVRQKLQAAGIPVVEAWDITRSPLDVLVGFSHQRVGQVAARYLGQRGAKRPAVTTPSNRRAQARVRASVRAFGSEAYIPVMAAESPASLGDGRRAPGILLEQHLDTDVIFCGAGILTLGALMKAEHRDIAVPAQPRMVDYGDQMFVKDTTPVFTTIHIDGTDVGKLAAALLINRIEHGDEERRTADVGFTLVEHDNV